MPNPVPPQCPRCGRNDAKLIKSEPNYYGPASTRYDEPKSVTMGYLCVCGMAMAETIRVAPLPPSGATPLKPARSLLSVGQGREILHSQPLRVLVVDDNRDAADTLAILMRVWGHDARVAYDGPAAVKLAEVFRPQVITLDIQMPGMHGGEVARKLRALPEFGQVKIYATSATDSNDNRLLAWQHLFDMHLGKPYNLAQLEELLANQIRSETERRE